MKNLNHRWTTQYANISRRALTLGPVALLVGAFTVPAWGVGLAFVEGVAFPEGSGNITPTSAIFGGTPVQTDNLWNYRTDFGTAGNVLESGQSENSNPLTQTITGLTPNKSYDLYAAFWTDKDENWTIQSGLSSGSLALYSFHGPSGGVAGSIKGVTAAAAVWDPNFLPPATADGTSFTQRPTDPLIMLLAKAGAATSNGAGELSITIDDRPAPNGGGTRSWFDGVAYVDAGTAIALAATINRATGALTIANPTSQAFQIKAITLDSPNGALSATGWTPVSGRLDGGGNMSFDTDVWSATPPATTPFATQLAEAEDPNTANGGTLAAGGGSIGLGNVWVKSPFEDVRLSLTLADNTLAIISPQYTGTPIVSGDFNGDGAINLGDYQTLLNNLHTTITAATNAGAYQVGDMTGDRAVNFNDFASFRTAFDLANGAGAFERMVATVPEPATLALAAAAAVVVVRYGRRRTTVAIMAMLVCLTVTRSSYAQALLSVDVDDREMAQRDMTDAGNTVTGFQSFQLSGTVPATGNAAAATTTTTQTLAGYTVSVTPVNASGVLQGGVDDRDRATPSTTPPLAQIYDDFLFTAGGVGAGGGIDMTVEGGSLQPNKPYTFSLYSFDSGSTGVVRTANWLDGNQGDGLLFSTSFSAANLPTTDDQYKYSALALTDATGKLFIRGRNTTPNTGTAINPGVFMNGFTVSEFSGLTLEVNTTTGLVRLLNDQTSSFDLSYYELRSPAGSLSLGGWVSRDDTEGGDPVGTGWDEAPASNANLLNEANLQSMTTLAPGGSISFGNAFTVGGAQDVRFLYSPPNGTTLTGAFVKYVTGGGNVVADFNHNGTVDGADLGVWRTAFGANATGDADSDGDSDGNDFLIWQRRLGATSAQASAAAVPEPAALLLAGLGFIPIVRRRRQAALNRVR